MQIDMFSPNRSPVVVAYGGGVDSTAMTIELVRRGESVDQILFADTGSEKAETLDYVAQFAKWCERQGLSFATVRYQPSRFGDNPVYQSLIENCLINKTLPSISMGFSSCSAKWKHVPQVRWISDWEPAQTAWRQGLKVTQLIGFDAGPRDLQRYARSNEHQTDSRFLMRFPLIEWGLTREHCVSVIKSAGLPIPPKSACIMCCATKPHELHAYDRGDLRLIVLIEAVAAPRLTKCEGLWRKAIKGARGAQARPGSMSEYISLQGLLDQDEIQEIQKVATASLERWKIRQASLPLENRQTMGQWVARFRARLISSESIPTRY